MKKIVKRMITAIMILVFIGSGLVLGALMLDRGDKVEEYIDAEDDYQTNTSDSDIEKKDNFMKNRVHWEDLLRDYPEVVAWIKIPGTPVNYPILQRKKDQQEDFYLHHAMNESYSFAGSIYIRNENKADFTDPVTVVYGHNMANGSMFGYVGRFEDKAYFNKHPYAYIYLPDHSTKRYQLFSFQVTDGLDIITKYNTQKEKGFLSYIQSLSSGLVYEKIDLGKDDRLLSISTCASFGDRRRILTGKEDLVQKGE